MVHSERSFYAPNVAPAAYNPRWQTRRAASTVNILRLGNSRQPCWESDSDATSTASADSLWGMHPARASSALAHHRLLFQRTASSTRPSLATKVSLAFSAPLGEQRPFQLAKRLREICSPQITLVPRAPSSPLPALQQPEKQALAIRLPQTCLPIRGREVGKQMAFEPIEPRNAPVVRKHPSSHNKGVAVDHPGRPHRGLAHVRHHDLSHCPAGPRFVHRIVVCRPWGPQQQGATHRSTGLRVPGHAPAIAVFAAARIAPALWCSSAFGTSSSHGAAETGSRARRANRRHMATRDCRATVPLTQPGPERPASPAQRSPTKPTGPPPRLANDPCHQRHGRWTRGRGLHCGTPVWCVQHAALAIPAVGQPGAALAMRTLMICLGLSGCCCAWHSGCSWHCCTRRRLAAGTSHNAAWCNRDHYHNTVGGWPTLGRVLGTAHYMPGMLSQLGIPPWYQKLPGHATPPRTADNKHRLSQKLRRQWAGGLTPWWAKMARVISRAMRRPFSRR